MNYSVFAGKLMKAAKPRVDATDEYSMEMARPNSISIQYGPVILELHAFL